MARRTFRVWFVAHGDGRVTASLIPTKTGLFSPPPPSAYGRSESEVLAEIELRLAEMSVTGSDDPERFRWEEPFHVRKTTVEVHPQVRLEHRTVIGKEAIPLRMVYAWTELTNGGFRVMLPRYGWWLVLEDLESAPEVLRNAISSALLGENPRWLYEFREEADEYVREWLPERMDRLQPPKPREDLALRYPTLSAVAEEWVDRARTGRLPLVIGEPIGSGDQALLIRPRPISMLLVGPPGVGKTAWVRKAAMYLVAMRRERDALPAERLWATHADRILGGMVYLGMWQQRCLDLVRELGESGDWLYVDRLAAILREQTDGGSIAEALAPAILAQEIRVIAECTPEELERALERAPALVSGFHLVRIHEPPQLGMPATMSMWQSKHRTRVRLGIPALKRAVRHLGAFQRATAFPGKAFRFLESLEQDEAIPRPPAGSTVGLDPSGVTAAFARWSGLPVALLDDERPLPRDQIAAELKAGVIGQDGACDACAEVIARFRAGLEDPERPLGSLFFVGPTGVGKTELAKQLARWLFGSEKRMIRLDMSEYAAYGAAGRMLQVGEGATSLAEQVRRQPLCLVLFDEIEKAHPQAFDLLLGILGEGRLTDVLGRLVDFRTTLIVMTSNLGAGDAPPISFEEGAAQDFTRAVRQHFRPELFGRIDRVLPFRALEPEDVLRIVDLELAKSATRTGLQRRGLRIHVDPGAREWLARHGFDRRYGARPLKRLIEEKLIAPLALRMSEDPTFRDREIRVTIESLSV